MIKIKRVAIFMDEANIISSAMKLKIFIDYVKLRDCLLESNEIYNCFFYSRGSYDDYHKSTKSGMLKRLTLNGFTVKMKPIKKIPKKDNPEETEDKCNIDVELTLDVITTVNNFDIAILLTGDGDFSKLVEYLRFLGKEIYAASTKELCAIDLKNIVDKYIPLESLISQIKIEKPYDK